MTAQIRLVSSEAGDAAELARLRRTPPIARTPLFGLPEEGGSNREAILGEAPPPLAIEPNDRTRRQGKTSGGRTTGIGKLIAFVWPPKRKAVSRAAGAGGEGERKGDEAPAASPAAICDEGPIGLAEESGPGTLVAGRETPAASAASVEGAGERKDMAGRRCGSFARRRRRGCKRGRRGRAGRKFATARRSR